MKLRGQQAGYAMVALLVGLSVMAIMMTVALPVWKTAAQREKEAELIFRGQQYVRALELYQRKLPGAAPANLDVLIDQKFLRKKYKDPITGDDFELLGPNSPAAGLSAPQPPGGRTGGPPVSRGAAPTPGPSSQGGRGANAPAVVGGIQAGISGVASKSKAASLRLYNGRSHYNEWQFVYVARAQAPGAGGGAGSGVPGRRGGPGDIQPVVGPGGRGFPGRGDGRGFPPGRGDGRGFPPNAPGQPGGARGPGGQGGQPFPQGGQPFTPGIQPFPQRPPGN